jgi:acetylornithine deacetylase/succinyl-diaminopimelate desuccinylase-like protein
MSSNPLTTYKELLTTVVAQQSISTDPQFAPEVAATAEMLSAWLTNLGFTSEQITGYGNPLVLARYTVAPELPTCLIYGHYDVQPAAQTDGWDQNPFTLTEADGRYVGRGAVDNKGQFLIHLSSVANLIAEQRLAWNIEVLLEGDEETGSAGITQFLKDHPEKITASLAIVSDGEIHNLQPKLEIGYRGGMQVNVQVRTAQTDLHSGIFGGTVPNAALELSRLLGTLTKSDGALTVSGIAAGAHQPSTQELAWAEAANLSGDAYLELSTTKTSWNPNQPSLGAQLIFEPTIEIIGLSAGYMGEGFRNSIPATAAAKLNVRIAPGQNPEAAYLSLAKHLQKHTPEYAELILDHEPHNPGILVDASSPYIQHVAKILEASYGSAPLFAYCGASLPFLEGFQAIPNLALALIPLGNDDCLMHAVGENIAVANVEKGLAFSQQFFATPPQLS